MIPFKLTDELLENIQGLIAQGNDKQLRHLMKEFHYADVAEIANELEEEEATYLIKLLDSEKNLRRACRT